MNIPAALIASIVALSAAYMTGRMHGGDKVRTAWDKERSEQVAATLDAERAMQAKAQEIEADAQKQIDKARADSRRVAVVADGLRDKLAAVTYPADSSAIGCADVAAERDELARLLAEAGSLLSEGRRIGGELAEVADGLQRHNAEVGKVPLK
jgi:ABC-type transporter Mla subunit MlaD